MCPSDLIQPPCCGAPHFSGRKKDRALSGAIRRYPALSGTTCHNMPLAATNPQNSQKNIPNKKFHATGIAHRKHRRALTRQRQLGRQESFTDSEKKRGGDDWEVRRPREGHRHPTLLETKRCLKRCLKRCFKERASHTHRKEREKRARVGGKRPFETPKRLQMAIERERERATGKSWWKKS